MGSAALWRRLEGIGIVLIALHSFLIGVALLVATRWVLDFAGWTGIESLFFPRQSGAFHIVLALGYLIEHRRTGGISLLILAKATAVVFLLVLSPAVTSWSVKFSGVFDGLMLAGMVGVRLMLRRALGDGRVVR